MVINDVVGDASLGGRKKLALMSADFAIRYKLQAENACEQQVLGSEWSSNPTGFGQRVSTKPSASL
jgi:hypothetical protein